MATTKQFVRRPYPNMYNFLIDEYADHLAKAGRAWKAGQLPEYRTEMEKAQMARDDFLLIIQELSPYHTRELWAAWRQVGAALDGRE